MPIISDVHGKIRTVLNDIRDELGPRTEFAARDFVSRYAKRYPGDIDLIDERRKKQAGAHSLDGYLDGMLALHVRTRKGPHCPAARIGPKRYRTL